MSQIIPMKEVPVGERFQFLGGKRIYRVVAQTRRHTIYEDVRSSDEFSQHAGRVAQVVLLIPKGRALRELPIGTAFQFTDRDEAPCFEVTAQGQCLTLIIRPSTGFESAHPNTETVYPND